MEEALSPRQRAAMINRLQSPSTAFFLGSNDDKLERAQARAAARAAAIRRTAPVTHPSSPPSDYCLSKQQIIDLFQNCIKLATENHIKCQWEFDGWETCTLEAGVEIYCQSGCRAWIGKWPEFVLLRNNDGNYFIDFFF